MKNLHSKMRLLVEGLELFALEMPSDGKEFTESRDDLHELYDLIFRPKHQHTVQVAEGKETMRLSDDLWLSKTPSRAFKAAEVLAHHLMLAYHLDKRLIFVDASFSIYLDGDLYEHLDPVGYWVIKTLAAYPNEYMNTGLVIARINDSISQLNNNSNSTKRPGRKQTLFIQEGATGKKRLDRAIKRLPRELQKILKGQRGSGRMLQLP